jgi:hypothetical protein
MENQELTLAINQLKESVDSLVGIHNDLFNADTSTDDMMALRNKMAALIESNKELRESIGFLNGAINELTNNIKKM